MSRTLEKGDQEKRNTHSRLRSLAATRCKWAWIADYDMLGARRPVSEKMP